MSNVGNFHIFALIACATASTCVSGNQVIDDNAQVVKLRYDDPTKSDDGCQEAGVVLSNCFTTGPDLLSWVTQTRNPATNGRLLVDIGPGTFTGFGMPFDSCNISLRGSGRQITILDRGSLAYALSGTASCNADFSNMTFRSIGGLGGINLNASSTGVTTTWTDVEIDSTAYGWTEGNCSTAKHYWFNSRIATKTGFGIARAYSSCSENWFFASEISATGTQGEPVGEVFALGLSGTESRETHVYGSVIRAVAETGVFLPNASVYPGGKTVKGLVAVSVGAASSLHIHGTGIDALSAEDNHIAVLGAGGEGSKLHANASAFNLRTGSNGSVTRIFNPTGLGHVHAPYQWEHVPDTDGDPSTNNTNFRSKSGADQTTITAADGHPHPAIYSDACPPTAKWYDTVDKVCRNH